MIATIVVNRLSGRFLFLKWLNKKLYLASFDKAQELGRRIIQIKINVQYRRNAVNRSEINTFLKSGQQLRREQT